ncbi:ASST-domain-containing protein [Aspergillus cavernicola]|uniref:ASST-domain-containing protein n=1 Tax=Aspergillus cavernicola TaxID=176166 RepID=A0ABR4HZK6_9EURO
MAPGQKTSLKSDKNFLLGLACILALIGVIDCATWTSFQSRPDIRAPVLEISIKDDSHISPSYIFLAPYAGDTPGPYIYDNNANLIWSGADGSTTDLFHNLHVCPYDGSDHLCFFQGTLLEGYARGLHTILDSSYKPTTSVQSGDGLVESDMHEMAVLDGKTILITVYQPRTYNLKSYGITPGPGWIIDGVFQEIDIKNGEVLFEWKSLDHVPPSESYTPLGMNDVIGDGRSNDTAWDYFHINSVDKNTDGDYIVSSRHTSCIYKISGKDGSVIWQLGGTQPSIHLTNYNFSSQHDARFREENDTTTVLSLFDNGSNRYRNTSLSSTGMIVYIDHDTNSSTMIKEYHAPGAGLQSWSQGNMQILPNKNVVIGWGNNPSISEHLEDGTPVFFATVADSISMNYRAFKYNWAGKPDEPPTLRTYSPSPNSATTFWVSWNGATDVDYWNIYATASTEEQFIHLTKADNLGFQTTYVSASYYPQAFAEAVGKDGTSLANSSIVTTSSIVPG